MWRVKIFVLCDNYRINGDKKLAEAVEVAIAKRTLGVNVGLLPRKRIGIDTAAVSLSNRGGQHSGKYLKKLNFVVNSARG